MTRTFRILHHCVRMCQRENLNWDGVTLVSGEIYFVLQDEDITPPAPAFHIPSPPPTTPPTMPHQHHHQKPTPAPSPLAHFDRRWINIRPTFGVWLSDTWPDILWMAAMGALGLGIYMAPPAPTRLFPIEFMDGEVVYPQFAYPMRKNVRIFFCHRPPESVNLKGIGN